MKELLETSVGGYRMHRGTIRDYYFIRRPRRTLVITTDRVPFVPNGIPGLGRILNYISTFWMSLVIKGMQPNHLIPGGMENLPEPFKSERFWGRIMLCRQVNVLKYVCGVTAYKMDPADPTGNCKLDNPIFWILNKDGSPCRFEKMIANSGLETAYLVRQRSLEIYKSASGVALERGLTLVEARLGFGLDGEGNLILVEPPTPDTSVFWFGEDKIPLDQPILDWMRGLPCRVLNGQDPPPPLPEALISQMLDNYLRFCLTLTGGSPRGVIR